MGFVVNVDNNSVELRRTSRLRTHSSNGSEQRADKKKQHSSDAKKKKKIKQKRRRNKETLIIIICYPFFSPLRSARPPLAASENFGTSIRNAFMITFEICLRAVVDDSHARATGNVRCVAVLAIRRSTEWNCFGPARDEGTRRAHSSNDSSSNSFVCWRKSFRFYLEVTSTIVHRPLNGSHLPFHLLFAPCTVCAI